MNRTDPNGKDSLLEDALTIATNVLRSAQSYVTLHSHEIAYLGYVAAATYATYGELDKYVPTDFGTTQPPVPIALIEIRGILIAAGAWAIAEAFCPAVLL